VFDEVEDWIECVVAADTGDVNVEFVEVEVCSVPETGTMAYEVEERTC